MDGWIDGDGWDGMGREIKRKGMRERRREREREREMSIRQMNEQTR